MLKKTISALMLAVTMAPTFADDNVLYNGRFFTMNESRPWAEAVLIRDGTLAFVGDKAEAIKIAKKGADTSDLGGKLVLPGLIDTHAHPTFGSVMASGLLIDTSNSSVDSYLKQIKAYALANPDLPAIFGFGFYAAEFGEGGPLKSQLDAIVADRPVVLMDDGGHSAWANTLAFELADINRDTPDPEPGVHFYRRDKSGEPTGHALESQAVFPLMAAVGIFDVENIKRSLQGFLPVLPAMGFTTVFEAGMLAANETGHQALHQLDQKGELKTRVITAYSLYAKSQVGKAAAELASLKKRFQSELLRPTTLKVHNDGTTEAETAAQFGHYLNDKSNVGAMILEGEALANVVTDTARKGFDVHIHGIGEKAVREALDAFGAARSAGVDSSRRFSIAHVELISDQDVPRFGLLDVVAQSTPLWAAMERGHSIAVLGAERSARQFAVGGVLASGGKLTFGSDFPVSEGLHGLNPMVQIESGVTRALPGEEVSTAQPDVASMLSVAQMVRGYTIDAAYQLGLEGQVGSIEVGKKADLAVLSGNIFAMAPQQIHKVKTVQTYLDGVLVYDRQSAPRELLDLLD